MPSPRKVAGYGWRKDHPDARDWRFDSPPVHVTGAVDLSGGCPPVYDQGQLGSCTANAIAGALEFDQLKQREKSFVPSRLFIYYNERVIEGTADSDSGAELRDGIKTVAADGSPCEELWPYDVAKFADKPDAAAYEAATKFKAVTYRRVDQTLQGLKGALASGYPFVFGFTVYESFESDEVARTGAVPMPAPGEATVGGHAVLAVGYDDLKGFKVRNSWGDGWGQAGYFDIPFAYLTSADLASDFWVVQTVS